MTNKIIIPEETKYIGAFLTMRCNLKCSYCINDFDESRPMDRKSFKEISGQQWINFFNRIEFVPGFKKPITLSGGEPSLHRDFIDIINNTSEELNFNILTNLIWNEAKINDFIQNANPSKITGNPKYPAIRASYHPEQMGTGEQLIENVDLLKDAGFSVGIESVMYPGDNQLTAIEQMAIRCRNKDISFRVKSFMGLFEGKDKIGTDFSIKYGNYSTYPDSVFQNKSLDCLCKTSELLIGPNGDIYKCHKDLYSQDNPVANITYPEAKVELKFRKCSNYGYCNPCDVKDKTNSNQELGHTSVKIKDIKRSNP